MGVDCRALDLNLKLAIRQKDICIHAYTNFCMKKITHDTLTIHVKENRRTTDLKVYLQEQHKFVKFMVCL